jgi:hypothetical protein
MQTAPPPLAQRKKLGKVNTQAQGRQHGLIGWALPCQGWPGKATTASWPAHDQEASHHQRLTGGRLWPVTAA